MEVQLYCFLALRNTLQHTATHCNTLQHTATHCNTLQHTQLYCFLALPEVSFSRTRTHFRFLCFFLSLSPSVSLSSSLE